MASHTAIPIAGRIAISQKISLHRCWSINGPMVRSSTKFTSDQEPEAMPDIMRGLLAREGVRADLQRNHLEATADEAGP